MTQHVSLPALQAMFAQETGEVFLSCLTITHPDLAEPIRLVDDTQNRVRTAGTFLACPFDVSLPADEDQRPPQVRLTVDNVDRTILAALRALSEPPTITIEVVLASSPNTVEAGPFVMTLKDIQYDASTIQGRLAYEDILNEPFPKDLFTPQIAPGLFG